MRSPQLLPRYLVDRFVSEKSDWIRKKLADFSQPSVGLLYLGQKAKFIFDESLRFSNEQIYLKILGSSQLEKDRAIESFYKQQSVHFVTKFLIRHGGDYNFSKVVYRKYKSKWGSCSPSNELNFNSRLSMCPENVIEYIVVHELCHTRVKNHSKNFYKEVQKILPNYREPLRWLRTNRGII